MKTLIYRFKTAFAVTIVILATIVTTTGCQKTQSLPSQPVVSVPSATKSGNTGTGTGWVAASSDGIINMPDLTYSLVYSADISVFMHQTGDEGENSIQELPADGYGFTAEQGKVIISYWGGDKRPFSNAIFKVIIAQP